MKRRKPDEREIVRILNGIRSDLAELRQVFERVRERIDAQASSGPRGA